MKIKNRDTNEIILEVKSLKDADLIKVDLRGADLRYVDLRGADLEGTDLRYADLKGADLEDANLRDVDLKGADLKGAYLEGAYLEGALNYYSFVAYESSKRIVHCVKHDDTWMVQAGCFWGNLDELKERVINTNKSLVYLANIEILKKI